MKRVLLVDNDPDILELLRMGLTEYGFSIVTARSGLEAVRALEQFVPDVLITDLIMPDISGEKLLRIVRSVPEWRTIGTIVVSGVAAEAPEWRDRLPCDIYIAKGPIGETLRHIVASLRDFDHMRELSQSQTIGLDGIYHRHITRELLDYRSDVETILNHMSDGVCSINREGTVVWLNRRFAHYAARREEVLLGQSLARVVGDAARDELIAYADGAAAEPLPAMHATFVDSGREVRVTVLHGFGAGNGKAALLWQEVSDRLLAEERYENIVESAADLVWTADREGVLTYVSRASTTILETSPEEMIGHAVWSFVDSDQQEALKREVHRVIAHLDEGSDNRTAVGVWRRSAGDTGPRWLQTRISALRDRAGAAIGLRGTFSDITAQRKLEREREALTHELNHRVRDNLQLLASLSRLVEPERLEGRIAAVGEVFDELYRERSFSDIDPEALIHRVLPLMAGAAFQHLTATFRITSDVRALPMKTAVPLVLFLQEAFELAAARIEPAGTTGGTILFERAEAGAVLAVEFLCADGVSDGTPRQTDTIIHRIAEQLGGSVQMRSDGGAFTIRTAVRW